MKVSSISYGNITFLNYWFEKLFGIVVELNICLSYNPVISLLGFTLENAKIHSFKDLCRNFYSKFIIAITQKQYKHPSTCVWINNFGIYIHTTEFYSGIKRNKLLIHLTPWIKPTDIILSKKKVTKEYILYNSILMKLWIVCMKF